MTAPARPAALGVPGLRTLRSARFRLVLAVTLWTAGTLVLGGVLMRQAADPEGQYAFDFAAYHAAAAELAAGRTPYAAEMFDGPIPSQGAVLYKYPPLFAQALTPLAGLPLPVAAALWLAMQWVMLVAGTWVAARAGGARPSAETLAWSAVAVTLFLPAFDTLWKGNVSGALALGVAIVLLGGARGGLGVGASVLLKTTPAVLLALLAVAGRRPLLGAVTWLPIVGLSLLASPAAWHDYARLLPNLVSGPSIYATNLAPHSLASFHLVGAPALVEVVRLAAVAFGLGAVGGSMILARRPDAWPAAVTLAVAALLLLPSATWYHYLAVLLPLAAYSWPRAGRAARAGLLGGAAAISLGVAWLPLAVLGAVAILSGSLVRRGALGGTVGARAAAGAAGET